MSADTNLSNITMTGTNKEQTVLVINPYSYSSAGLDD